MTTNKNQRDDRETVEGVTPGLVRQVLPRSAWRRLFAVLALFIVADTAIGLVCPMFGGDCLYGFLTLIAFPVMLSGPLGMLLPRYARCHSPNRLARGAIFVVGGVVLLAAVTACHVLAIRVFNELDYGGVLVRHRLLWVELGLSAAYYSVLGGISYANTEVYRREPVRPPE